MKNIKFLKRLIKKKYIGYIKMRRINLLIRELKYYNKEDTIGVPQETMLLISAYAKHLNG